MAKSWFSRLFSSPSELESDAGPGENSQGDADAALTQASQGDAEAQYGLGLKFALGDETTVDYGQAADWYRKAAAQNHCLAQFNLGLMYAHGQGVARDDAQSAQWFYKAAIQGDAGAQHYLGGTYHRASFGGLPQEAAESRIEAYKWYRLSAAQGYRGADTACSTLLFKMTGEDVLTGDRRAAAFVVEKSPSPA